MIFIKLIYMLLFGALNFIIYDKLNRTGKVNSSLFKYFLIIFVTVVAISLLQISFVLPLEAMFVLLFFSVAIIFFYAIFKFSFLKDIKESNIAAKEWFIKVFSFVFLKLVPLALFVFQCAFILYQRPLK